MDDDIESDGVLVQELRFGGIPGEGSVSVPPTPRFVSVEIKEKKLNFEEASQCLTALGKDESGVRYAYLMISAVDRKLTDVSVILNFKHVLFLDLSGNFLTLDAVQCLTEMPFLIFLGLERNRIDSAALNPVYYLQVLTLNKNLIKETCDINQPMLDTLELDDNLIYTAQFDSERLKNVKELCLAGNSLLDLSGSYPKNVEKLYLGRNKISRIVLEFQTVPNLQVLHLRGNNIRKLDGFSEHLENLTYLNLRSNKINKIRQFRKLSCLPNLQTLIYLDNPAHGQQLEQKEFQGEDRDEEIEGEGDEPVSIDRTRVQVLVLLPKLRRINKDEVTLDEREAAEESKRKILEGIFEEESSEDETEGRTTTEYSTTYTTESDLENIHLSPSAIFDDIEESENI